MGVAFQPRSLRFRPLDASSRGGPPRDHLPPEIAFLREYGVRSELLKAAVREALREGTWTRARPSSPAGGITDTLYYRSLAHLLDAPFRTDPSFAGPPHGCAPCAARRQGQARRRKLADGTDRCHASIAARRCARAGRAAAPHRAHDACAPRGSGAPPRGRRRWHGARAWRSRRFSRAFCARGAMDTRAVGVALGILLAASTHVPADAHDPRHARRVRSSLPR